MSSPTNGNALSAHEMFKDEHLQIARSIKDGLGTYFPMSSDGSRYFVDIEEVYVDRKNDKAQTPGFLTSARFEGRSYDMPIRAKVVVTVDGKVADRKDVKIGSYYPVAEGLGARLIKGSIYQNKYQVRRKPGVYPFKNSQTSLVEFNTSHGRSFNFVMDFNKEDTPTLDLRITGGNPSTIKRGVYTLLKMFNVPQGQIESALGPIYRYNAFKTSRGSDVNGAPVDIQAEGIKVFKKLIPSAAAEKLLDKKTPESYSSAALFEKFREFWSTGKSFDAGVPKDTVGVSSSFLTGDIAIAATRKIVALYNGDEESDHRFSEKYRSLHGVPTQIREGFVMDKKLSTSIRNKVKKNLNYAEKKNVSAETLKVADIFDSVKNIISDKIVKSFTQSELSTTTETNNILDIDTRSKEVTIKGPGGIQNTHAIQADTVHLHPSRLGLTDFLKTQASAPGVTVPLANGATFSNTGEIHRLLYDRKIDKVRSVSSEESDVGGVGFPDDFQVKKIGGKSTYVPKQKLVFATVGNDVKKVDEKSVRYILLDMSHAFSDTVNLIPFLNHNSGPRAIFGANQMTQALSLENPEAPLVQTLDETGKTFGQRIGERYNVTSKTDGVVVDIGKDSVTIEDSKKARVQHPLLKNFPLNQGGFIDMDTIVSKGDVVRKGDLLTRSNYTDKKGELAIGKNLRTAYMAWKGLNYEDGIVMSESASKRMSSEHVDEFTISIKDHIKTGANSYLGAFRGRGKNIENRNDLDEDGVIKDGKTVNEGDFLVAAYSEPYLKNDPQINNAMERVFGDLGLNKKDVSLVWHKPFKGKVIRVVKSSTEVKVFVRSVQEFKVGDKLSSYHGNKGIVSAILPDKEMPHTPDGLPMELLLAPEGVPSRANPGQIFELAASRIAEKRGKPYKIRNFHDDNASEIFKDMKKERLKDKEKLTFEDGSKTVEPVAWGYEYMGKLKHQLDKKFSVRSINDGYSLDHQPVGGAAIDNLSVYAMIGHNARANLKEMSSLKGTENHDFWSDLANDQNPRIPNKVPFAFNKFTEMMRGLGVDIKTANGNLELAPLTDEQVLKDSSGEIVSSQRFETHRVAGPNPFKKGLFDEKLIGRGGVNRNHIDMGETMPNPVFSGSIAYTLKYALPKEATILKGGGKEQPIKTISQSDIKNVFLGKQHISYKGKKYSGGQGLKDVLSLIDSKKAEVSLKESLSSQISKKGDINATTANEKHLALRYLANINEKGIPLSEGFMMSKIPVIPGQYRKPIIRKDWEMTTPAVNDLYASLIGETEQLKNLKAKFAPKEMVQDQREKTFQALGALMGAKGVRPIGGFTSTSIMSTLTNPQSLHASDEYGGRDTDSGSPKRGYIQKKVVKKGQELSGRSTIIPQGTVIDGTDDLDVDQVGIPEEMAWKLYEPFVRKQLTREMGSAQKARTEFAGQTTRAQRVLERVVKDRPALINRAPSWWPYNVMAMDPVVIWAKKGKDGKPLDSGKEKALRIPNMVVSSFFGGDFDGDTMSVMIPTTEKAVEEAQKMKPSQHLYGFGSKKLMIIPGDAQLAGLYFLSKVDKRKSPQKPPDGISTVKKLAEALESGKILQDNAGIRYNIQGEVWTPGWALIDEAIRYVTGRKHGINTVFEEINKEGGKKYTREDFTLDKSAMEKVFVPALISLWPTDYARIAQRLVRIGDMASTKQGMSIGISDLVTDEKMVQGAINTAERYVPTLARKMADEKNEKISPAHIEAARIELMTPGDPIEVSKGKFIPRAATAIEDGLKNKKSENSFIRMMQIGSKGNTSQIRQILGANLNVSNVLKKIEPEVIKGNFAKGLKGGEYFIAQHGALSGLRDRAVETSAPGYLGKKIIMSSQELVVSEQDCGTNVGSDTPLMRDNKPNMKDLDGRFEVGTKKEFTSAYVMELHRKGKESVVVRSPMYCTARVGVCAICYGRKTDGNMPEIGFNAGVVEGQAIINTSANMTLKSFHTSGASKKSAPSFERLEEIVELRAPKFKATLFEGPPGEKVKVLSAPIIANKTQERTVSYEIIGTKEIKNISLKPGQDLKRDHLGEIMIKRQSILNVGDPITEGDIDPIDLVKYRGNNSLSKFEAKRDYVSKELHNLFEGIGANFSRRTSETAVASMGSFVTIKNPGDSTFFPYDKIKFGEAESYNQQALKKGQKPMTYDRLLEPTRRVPLIGENWLSKLNFEKLKNTIRVGAITGQKTPIHGANPISSYMIGNEFGEGKEKWQY